MQQGDSQSPGFQAAILFKQQFVCALKIRQHPGQLTWRPSHSYTQHSIHAQFRLINARSLSYNRLDHV